MEKQHLEAMVADAGDGYDDRSHRIVGTVNEWIIHEVAREGMEAWN